MCSSCAKGKQHRFPFSTSTSTTQEKLELVHSDVCGPMPEPSYAGHQYFLTFIDDYSKMTFEYFMKSKSEVFDHLKDFIVSSERRSGKKLKTFRSDNGTEYTNHRVTQYLRDKGIRHELTIGYSPQQNGVAERANRTLMEKARAMIANSELPKCFWAEAIHTACKLKNVGPTSSLKSQTPEELWTGKNPNLRFQRVFGCLAYGHVPKELRKKLDFKAEEHFLGVLRNLQSLSTCADR